MLGNEITVGSRRACPHLGVHAVGSCKVCFDCRRLLPEAVVLCSIGAGEAGENKASEEDAHCV